MSSANSLSHRRLKRERSDGSATSSLVLSFEDYEKATNKQPDELATLASNLNDQGVTLIEQKQYSHAKRVLRKALHAAKKNKLTTSNLSCTDAPDQIKNKDFTDIAGLISSIIAPTSSQKKNDLKQVYKHRPEYDEGMDFFGVGLRLYNSSRNIDATVFYNLGRVYHFQERLDKAMHFYQQSLALLERWEVCDAATMLALLFAIANINYLRNEHVESLKTCDVALSLATDFFGKESLQVAACLNCIGVIKYIMPCGESDQALDALHTCLRLRKCTLGENHLDVGTTWNNIGRVNFQRGDYSDAMVAYRHALRIRQAILGESIDVAATIFNMAQAHHQLAEISAALTLYEKFLGMAIIHFGQYHRDIAIVMTCIGQMHHENKSHKEAVTAFKEALRVGRIVLGPLHPEIAITLNKIGNLHYEMGDLGAALEFYQQGLDVEQAVLEEGNSNAVVTMTNIAEIHKQRCEFSDALEYYMKIYVFHKKYNVDNGQEIANTLSGIGFVHHQMGDYTAALEFNQECLRIRRDLNGDISEDVAVTLTHIALVLLKMDMYDMALEVLTESYKIRKTLETDDTRDIAFTLYNIAMIYHHRGNYEHALLFYRETARVEQSALGHAHRDLGMTLYNIGQIHYQRGEMDLALEKFVETLAIERECLGREHPTCARTLNEIGNIELQRGNVEKVMECFTEALRIYRKSGMDDNLLMIYGRKLFRFEKGYPNASPAA
mmetsp:Transcript_20021/g.29683  ORF Transcript_20021/g.29683 Transcript_20021/m.29683 type:complete len:722 (+) Transcript_20021:88-2253(+)